MYVQALEVIRILQETIPLQRASMRLKVTLPAREARHVRDKILPHLTVQHEEWDSDQLCIVSIIILLDLYCSYVQCLSFTEATLVCSKTHPVNEKKFGSAPYSREYRVL